MTRLNLALFAILLASALGTVASQHQARKLYIELQQQAERAKGYEVEWGQLQLEQSTWAMHARIERVATTRLRMRVAEPERVQVVAP